MQDVDSAHFCLSIWLNWLLGSAFHHAFSRFSRARWLCFAGYDHYHIASQLLHTKHNKFYCKSVLHINQWFRNSLKGSWTKLFVASSRDQRMWERKRPKVIIEWFFNYFPNNHVLLCVIPRDHSYLLTFLIIIIVFLHFEKSQNILLHILTLSWYTCCITACSLLIRSHLYYCKWCTTSVTYLWLKFGTHHNVKLKNLYLGFACFYQCFVDQEVVSPCKVSVKSKTLSNLTFRF